MKPPATYEVQSYAGSQWKIEAFFDDHDLALAEARRMNESRRHFAVRVVEECFDASTETAITRTVYRSTPIDEHNKKRLEATAQTRKQVNLERAQRRPPARRPDHRHTTMLASAKLSHLLVKGAAIFVVGFGAILSIRFLAGQ